MIISNITSCLESVAPLSYQEGYDNSGLIVGDPTKECSAILCTLDVTEQVVLEAISRNCNCIVAHHPLIFSGLKKINGNSYVERAVILAIKNDIAIYAAHTNLDNVIDGVNGKIADKLGLINRKVLAPAPSVLKKLFTFVPPAYLEQVRTAIFEAGGGAISNYTECSFVSEGTGTFKPGAGTKPFTGIIGERKEEHEIKLEVIVPAYLEAKIIRALLGSHPYEEVAYEMVGISNTHEEIGSGLTGELEDGILENDFLTLLKQRFGLTVIRYTSLTGIPVKKIAVCGGAGSFLITKALAEGVQAFVTADLKYHEFFGAEGRMLLCDIGHFESEQFTTELLIEILLQKFPTFAVLKSEVRTNPVNYFTA